jgi:hypothetical protein
VTFQNVWFRFFLLRVINNVERRENGEWKYSVEHCVYDFQNAFLNFPVDYQKVIQQIYECVAKFRNVGTVGRQAGSGTPKKRTPEIVADVAARKEQSPKNLSAG